MILGERVVTCRHDSGDSVGILKELLHVGMILGERDVTCRHDSGGKRCYM